MDPLEAIELALAPLHKRCKYALPPPTHLASEASSGSASAERHSGGSNDTSYVGSAQQRALRLQAEAACLARLQNVAAWKARLDDGARRGTALAQTVRDVEEQLDSLITITTSIREESEHLSAGASALMVRKSRLERTFEQTKAILMRFQKVDELANEASNPALNASTARFAAMLDEIDELSEYLRRCRGFKSAGLFSSKLALAQQRASMCLRETIVADINEAAGAVLESHAYTQLFADPSRVPFHHAAEPLRSQSAQGPPPTEAVHIEHHPDFSVALSRATNIWLRAAERRVALRRMLEARAAAADDPDAAEVLTTYREARVRVVAPLVDDYVAAAVGAEGGPGHLTAFASAALAHFSEVAASESSVYESMWLREDFCGALLPQLLGDVAESLYSTFRSWLLRVDCVEQLSLVCTTLAQRSSDSQQGSHAAVAALARKMGEDAQERLIFRTSLFIRNRVAGCVPSTAELESLCTGSEGVDEAQGFKNGLRLLEMLYASVDRYVFEILAEECIEGLLHLLQRIERTTRSISCGSPPVLHGELLVLHHFLLLRAHVNKFDAPLSTIEKSIDVSQLAQRKLAIIQSSREAKKDIEGLLKSSCERVVRCASDFAAAPLRSLQSADDVSAAEEKLRDAIATIEAAMQFYVRTASTIAVLMKPIKLATQQAADNALASLGAPPGTTIHLDPE